MAEGADSFCVKCKTKLENQSDKIIKCYGTCGGYIHYLCSSFKPSELKFVETHKNMKWFCEQCTENKNGQLVSELSVKINELSKKISLLMDIVQEQTKKIDNQATIINNLQLKQTQNVYEKEARPCTRSQKPTLDGNANLNSTENIKIHLQNKKTEKLSHNTPNKNIEQSKTQQQKDIVQKPEINKESPQNKKMQTNVSKTNTSVTIRGNKNNTSITAAENIKFVFISQLQKTTTEEDIKDYLSQNNINIKSCYKLRIKSEEIAAFKIVVSENIYEEMFNPNLWPMNVIIRPFKSMNFRNRLPTTQAT